MQKSDSEAKSRPVNETSPHVLVVDDEPFVRNAFQLYLETHGYQVTAASNGPQAISAVKSLGGELDVVLLDLVMPGMYGLDVLNEIKALDPSIEVIIATGCGGVHSAIEAMRQGAFDYLTKPIVNFEKDLLSVVRGAVAAGSQARDPSTAASTVAPTLEETAARQEPEPFYNALGNLAQVALESPRKQSFASMLEVVVTEHLGADNALLLRKEGDDSPVEAVGYWGAPCPSTDRGVEEVACARLWQELSPARDYWHAVHLSPSALSAVHAGRDGRADPEGNVQALALELDRESNGTRWRFVCLRACQEDVGSPSQQLLALLGVVLCYALARNRLENSVAAGISG